MNWVIRMQLRPKEDEFNPYYANYINLVPDGDIEVILEEQIRETVSLLENVSEQQSEFRYAEGKWTIKEVIGHITDTERIMSYRLLSIARGETTSLPGYDDEKYVANAQFNRFSTQELLQQFQEVRQATLALLTTIDHMAWQQKGSANESVVSVRALAYIITGHERHHRKLLQDRYMASEKYPKK